MKRFPNEGKPKPSFTEYSEICMQPEGVKTLRVRISWPLIFSDFKTREYMLHDKLIIVAETELPVQNCSICAHATHLNYRISLRPSTLTPSLVVGEFMCRFDRGPHYINGTKHVMVTSMKCLLLLEKWIEMFDLFFIHCLSSQ